ncbi:MAG TPA: hypothetical protein VE650_12630 [Acetobacteraceae bacterium]|nr:hypothetical protein [Acetobacteraceae bacterium]
MVEAYEELALADFVAFFGRDLDHPQPGRLGMDREFVPRHH